MHTTGKDLEEILAGANVTPGRKSRLIKQASKKSFGIFAGQTDRKTLTVICNTVNAVCNTHYKPAELSYINAMFQIYSGFYCALFSGGLNALNHLALHNSSAVTKAEKISIGLGVVYVAVGTFRRHHIKKTGKATGSPTAVDAYGAFILRKIGLLGYLSDIALKLKMKADIRGEKRYHRREHFKQAIYRAGQLAYRIRGGAVEFGRELINESIDNIMISGMMINEKFKNAASYARKMGNYL